MHFIVAYRMCGYK